MSDETIAEAERLLAANNIDGIDVNWFAFTVSEAREMEAKGHSANQAFYALNGERKWGSAAGRASEVAVCHVFGIDRDALGYVHPGQMSHAQAATTRRKELVVLRGHRVKPRAVEALWRGVLYVGKETLITGMPGVGKSTMANYIAACVTTGKPFPGEPADMEREPGSVLILTAEDDPEDTLIPELQACGAEMSNVFIVPSAKIGDEYTGFDLNADLALIEEVVKGQDLTHGSTDSDPMKLIVVSPITAYLGVKADSNNVSQVRAVLDPMSAMLRRHRISGLYVGHPRKSAGDEIALYHTLGSVGFVAAARVCFYAMPDPESPDGSGRLLLRSKTNVDKDSPFGFGYSLVGATAVFEDGTAFNVKKAKWMGRDDRRPDDVLALAKELRSAKAEDSKLARARKLLEDELGMEPRRAAYLKNRAKECAISEATLDRAKAELGVIAQRVKNESWWKLPGTTDGQDNLDGVADREQRKPPRKMPDESQVQPPF